MAKLKTGRHTSAQKAHRQSERRAFRNKGIRKRIRAVAKDFLDAVERKDAEAVRKLTPKVASLWDKAAKTGVVHWKSAARKKARLAEKAKAFAVPA